MITEHYLTPTRRALRHDSFEAAEAQRKDSRSDSRREHGVAVQSEVSQNEFLASHPASLEQDATLSRGKLCSDSTPAWSVVFDLNSARSRSRQVKKCSLSGLPSAPLRTSNERSEPWA